jgi:hypothetical protein
MLPVSVPPDPVTVKLLSPVVCEITPVKFLVVPAVGHPKFVESSVVTLIFKFHVPERFAAGGTVSSPPPPPPPPPHPERTATTSTLNMLIRTDVFFINPLLSACDTQILNMIAQIS